MKKHLPLIITIIVMLIVVAGCIIAFNYFTKDDVNEEKTIVEEISTEPLYSVEEYPKIDASTATQPLAMAFIKNFTSKDVKDESMNFSKTHEAYVKLIKGDVDLILVTGPSEEELKLAKEAGIELEVIPVVREGFVFYVNSDNSIENLTISQIQDIYSGKIINWNELGGKDLAIKPYQRPVNSGSQTGMLDFVMKEKKLMTPLTENVVATMAEIINLVSSYDNGAASIGYSYYYYATTMYQTIDPQVASSIKLLAVDGVKPNIDTIKSGAYPFTTSYYIVINKAKDENSSARKLANAMLSTRGQSVAKEAGYVPVK